MKTKNWLIAIGIFFAINLLPLFWVALWKFITGAQVEAISVGFVMVFTAMASIIVTGAYITTISDR